MIDRSISKRIEESLRDTPVLFLAGARQTGKSTLARHVARKAGLAYFTLDDLSVLSSAKTDPMGFVAGLPSRAVIDEVQRAPNLLVAIKHEVDLDRRPGRFLLTGSSNVLTIPKLSESLAGRVEIHTLHPFSGGELAGHTGRFIDAAFSTAFPTGAGEPIASGQLAGMTATGGYPEAVARDSAARREAWFRNYITTIVQRDIRDLANIDGLTQIPDILRILAARCAGLLNVADIARSLQLSQTSVRRYLSLLESVFLVHRLQPWHVNLSLRLTKAPKVYLEDTGLACHLAGLDADRLEKNRTMLGQMLECFVVNELRKQVEWSTLRPSLYHFRTHEGHEVDCVMESADGRCVGIEVKAASQVSRADAKGLLFLREQLGSRFHRGILLHNGGSPVPFEANVHALPLSTLWTC